MTSRENRTQFLEQVERESPRVKMAREVSKMKGFTCNANYERSGSWMDRSVDSDVDRTKWK